MPALVLLALALLFLGTAKGSDLGELVGDPTDGTEVPFPPVNGVLMKPGVVFTGLHQNTVHAIAVARDVFHRLGFGPLVVTSVWDGTHMLTSLHYKGRAVDLRTRHLSLEQAREARDAMRAELGADYDVLNEGIGPGYDAQAAKHIHAEWDP